MTTIEEFRKDPEKRSKLKLSLLDMREALETLRDNGPEFRPQPIGLTPTDAATRLGHINGFAEFYQRLWQLTEPMRETETIEPTYPDPPENEE